MADKEFKINKRGEAQLAMWLPVPIVESIYKDYEENKDLPTNNVMGKISFKAYFYEKYLEPKMKKK